MYPSWLCGWNTKLESQAHHVLQLIFFGRDLAAGLSHQHRPSSSTARSLPRETGSREALWRFGLPRSRSGFCGEASPGAAGGLQVISSPRCAAFAHSFRLHTLLLCTPAAGGREPCVVCGFVPFINMQTIFGCSQGRSGIPALFPGFLLVHEKRKNNKEPVWLRLAELWADGDVTPSPAVTGCSQTGHALSTHGAGIGWWPPHASDPAAAQRLRGGSIQQRTKLQPSMKLKGISPRHRGGSQPSPECLALSSVLAHEAAPAWGWGDGGGGGGDYS